MKNALLTFPMLLLAVTTVCQQIPFHGVVTVQNSLYETGKVEYVSFASVEENENRAQSTLTDADGKFNLVLVGIPEKEHFSFQVKKEGLEVVNIAQSEAMCGQKEVVRIFMAKPKYLADFRSKIYNVGKTSAQKALEKKQQQLLADYNTEKAKTQQNQERIGLLEADLAKVFDQLTKVEQLANDLADKYQRVNLDDASEQYRDAFRLFQEGDLTQAQSLLQSSFIHAENIMAERTRLEILKKEIAERDSVQKKRTTETMQELRLKADLHKAQNEWDSVRQCYEVLLSLDSNNIDNLEVFASFLYHQNQPQRAILYYKKCLSITKTKEHEASICGGLGNTYFIQNKTPEAEKIYLRALDIFEQLAKVAPEQYEPDLAKTTMNLGNVYQNLNKKAEAEKMYLRTINIYDRLAKNNPARFKSSLAMTAMNFGVFYAKVQKAEAEKMYLRALDIYQQLAKNNPLQFEPELAKTCGNLGNFYYTILKMTEAEKMYLRALDIFERLAKSNPAQFEPVLAMATMNLGNFYQTVQKMAEAEKVYLRALDMYERLAKNNPLQFEPYLAMTTMNFGVFYAHVQKMAEAEKMYLRALDIYERLAKNNPLQFEPNLAKTCGNLGNFYATTQKMAEAEVMYLRALEIFERLAESNPAQFKPVLALTTMNLGVFYNTVQKMDEAENMFLRALNIYGQLTENNQSQFEPDLAKTCGNLGAFYFGIQKMSEAKNMYLRALDIYERLAQNNPLQFEPDLAVTMLNLGEFYQAEKHMQEAETMNLHSLNLYEHLAKNNPKRFEPYLAYSLNSYGNYCRQNQQFEKAQPLYSRAIALLQKALLIGQMYQREEFNKVYKNMAALRDSFKIRKDYMMAATIQRERTVCVDSLQQVDSIYMKLSALEYDTLSWYLLFTRNFPAAEAAARRSLALDPSQDSINLAHALLLQGKYYEAKKLYLAFTPEEHNDEKFNQSVLLDDLDVLETAGITHPDVAKVRILLKDQRPEKKDAPQSVDTSKVNINNQIKVNEVSEIQKMQSEQGEALTLLEKQKMKVKEAEIQFNKHKGEKTAAKVYAYQIGLLSIELLYAKQAARAEKEAERALGLAPSEDWINSYLALALLYQGKWEEAKAIYETWKGKPYSKKKTWTQLFLEDLNALVASGITHPDVVKARAWLKE
jgi:tetratricopeptide (TPR) repeat protein